MKRKRRILILILFSMATPILLLGWTIMNVGFYDKEHWRKKG
jgi:hypothetical protein